jgi:type I restriction enzyme, S subunit
MNGKTTVPLKYVADVRVSSVDKKTVEGQIPVRLCNYTDVYYQDTIRADQEFMEATATPEQLDAFRLAAHDVIITKDSETPEDIGVPAFVANSSRDLVCGYHLALLRPIPSRVEGRYLYWCMSSRPMRAYFAARATGVTRFGLRTEVIKAAPVIVPSLEEQRRILSFLDQNVARIERLNDLMRAQIERHQERAEALVTEVITAGLASVTPTWAGSR